MFSFFTVLICDGGQYSWIYVKALDKLMKFWKFGTKFQKSGLWDSIIEFGTIPNFLGHVESLIIQQSQKADLSYLSLDASEKWWMELPSTFPKSDGLMHLWIAISSRAGSLTLHFVYFAPHLRQYHPRALSSSLLCTVITCNHLLFLKIFLNFVHFCPSF